MTTRTHLIGRIHLFAIVMAMVTLATLFAPRVLPPALEPGREYPGYVLASVRSFPGW